MNVPMASAVHWRLNRMVEIPYWVLLFFAVTNPVERVDNAGDDVSGMTGDAFQETGVQGNGCGIRTVQAGYRP